MTYTLNSNIKFLYSYGGKIIPRRPDGVLRYIGGHTRVLSVNRSISFAELMIKFGESCEESMSLRCKLPSEDLDVLVSIKSDEDLKNMIEEYDRLKDVKVRAILSPIKSEKKLNSPPLSPMSCFDFPSPMNLKPPVNRFRLGRGKIYQSSPLKTTTNPDHAVRKETTYVHHHVYYTPYYSQ